MPAEEQKVVLPGDAALVGEPLRCVEHAVGYHVYEIGVADVVAAFEHVFGEKLG